MADAATSEPFNFELFDLSAGAFVTLSVTEAENKPGRGVVYSMFRLEHMPYCFLRQVVSVAYR
jgi:hypothetical protein